ncbi:ATP-dependent RNA helicase vasa-like [Rhopalosiphum maidis]|uniref:ATP-dependent RNA helicase vasa-like n=1 Tax=Rhopalosiphum maidis TaxID=43146 RepID=UPI000EFDE817|nr:ATP-dependent RNA helicase vasa-like [Rhopalosiphum maidis]
MAENWDNIPGINQEYGQLDQNATDSQTDENDWNNLAQNFKRKYKACTNYTDWDPINNNGHTDDDKLIEEFFENKTTTIESSGDTNAGRDDSSQTTSDVVEHQADTASYYENNEQINIECTDSNSLNDSWGNPISSDRYNNDIGNNSELNGSTKKNNYNDYHPGNSWSNDIETNNYQKYEKNGYHENVRSHQQSTRFPKKSNNDKRNGKFEKPIIQKSTYIPPEFEENDDLTLEAGLNFEKYDKIEVTVSGMEVPKNITSFQDSGLRQVLISNLTKCHYTIPTPIQKYAIPIIMNGKDMIASAQTGSGKTAAFVLPILNNLISEPAELIVDYNHCEPQALILSPTRELAIQICEVTTRLSRNTSIKCELLYGGTATYHQKERILRGGVHIIVATPGRLIDFVNRGLITFSSLRFFVLDEADRMLDMGFSLDIEHILNDNTMVSSAERSTVMFSATLPMDVQHIAKSYLKPDYISVAVGVVGGACKDVTQTFIEVNKFSKKNALVAMLNETNDCQGTIVFVEQKRQADFIAAFLSELNYPTTSIHGDREQPEREKALRDFKTKKMKVLVATAVAARGLDIMGVTTVVNFDLPKTIEEYVHRIGRTGRLGNSGRAVSFFDPANDHAMAPYLVNTLKLADQKVPEFLSQYSGKVQKPLNQFNDIRSNVPVTSEYVQEEEEW